MARLKDCSLYVFLIFTFFFLTVPAASASALINGQNFIQVKFKKSVNKSNKTANNTDTSQDSTSVVIVNSSPVSVSDNVPPVPLKQSVSGSADKKISNDKNNSKPAAINQNQKITINHKTPSADPDLIRSGLLANKENYKNNLTHIFPMIINKEIVHYIHYYQTAGKKFFEYALSRSQRYIPMIKKVFNKLGLPNDLAYLAMIESGFSPTAYSYAGASGMWQFIPSTGRLFGLTINWWVDERRNPVESTYAAGMYLKDLFDKFGSWYLAAAAYNSGELTIERALSVYPGGNFWTISQNKPYLLPGQTRRYVPKIIAAAIIAKDPENFGFHNIDYKKSIRFKQVNVPFSVSLYALAKCADISEYRLRSMNQDLLRNVTPPNDPRFLLNIPADKYNIFLKNFKNIKKYVSLEPKVSNISYERPKNKIYYTIEPGDTLMSIALKYRISLGTLENYNSLNNYSVLRIGERIIVPGTADKKTIEARSRSYKPDYVIVKPGMTLWGISRNYNVSVNTIKILNHISINDIHIGEKLFIKGRMPNHRYSYINNKNQLQHRKITHSILQYRVKFGDSLYSIALKFHDNVKNLMSDNSIKNPNSIYPGEIIKIYQ